MTLLALSLCLGSARAEPEIGFGFGEANLLARFVPAATNLNLDGETGFRSEFSGSDVHPLTGELLVVMRGAGMLSNQHGIQYYTPEGVYIRHVRLTGFHDLEGICVVDPVSNHIAVVEELLNAITILTVETNTTTLDKSEGRTLEMGLGNLGNNGIEGIAWDAVRSCFYAVKEWFPIAVYRVTDLGGTNSLTEVLFDAPARLGALCIDLSDIEYDVVTDRLLILSDESQVVVETDLDGNVLGTLPVPLNQPEGLSLSVSRRELYAIGEPNHYMRWESRPAYTVIKGQSLNVALEIDATPDPESPVSVEVLATGSNAVVGVTVLVSSNIVITAAETGRVMIAALDDLQLSPPGVVSLALTNAVNATLGPNAFAIGHIIDPGGFTGAVSTAGIGVPFRAVVAAIATNGTLLSDHAGFASLHLAGEVWRSIPVLEPTAAGYTSPTPTTRGVRFAPTRDLNVTHFRYFWGDGVSLWTDAGDLLATASGAENRGTWQTLALSSPVAIVSGQTYRVAAVRRDGSSPRVYHSNRALPATLAVAEILSGCFAPGDAFPHIVTNREYAVDLVVEAMVPGTVAVTPATIGPFAGGLWEGWLTATERVDEARLVIQNVYGQRGESGTFAVADYPPVELTLPTFVMENAGVLEDAGSVSLGTNGWDQPREVRLYVEPAGQVLTPAVVEVPAFAETATFDIEVVDDDLPEGARTVTLFATAPGYATGVEPLRVLDDDHPPGLLLRIVQNIP